jgi:hypothetical protein
MAFVAGHQVSHRRTRRIIGILWKLFAILRMARNTRPAYSEIQSYGASACLLSRGETCARPCNRPRAGRWREVASHYI